MHDIHGVLHLALDNAVRWGMVSRNVCDLVTPPRRFSVDGIKQGRKRLCKDASCLDLGRGERI